MNINKIAHWLLVIGGLNALLMAFHTGIANWFPWNVTMIIYVLIGVSALYKVFTHHNA